MTLRPRSFAALVVVMFTLPAAAQRGREAGPRPEDQPEAVVRAVVIAIQGRDVRSFESLSQPHPRRSVLIAGLANADAVRELRTNPQSLRISEARPLLFQGKPAVRDDRGQVPIGTTALYLVESDGDPTTMMMVRTAEGWKADLRWLIAQADLAAGVEPPRTGPDGPIRSLLAAMLKLDRVEAARHLSDARAVDFLFLSAPPSREPSGVLEAAVAEMPLVEIRPGEVFATVNGRTVEGVNAADRKVLVGLFGPIEIPFVVRRMGTDWRVEAEPYFMLLLQ